MVNSFSGLCRLEAAEGIVGTGKQSIEIIQSEDHRGKKLLKINDNGSPWVA